MCENSKRVIPSQKYLNFQFIYNWELAGLLRNYCLKIWRLGQFCEHFHISPLMNKQELSEKVGRELKAALLHKRY